MKFSPRLLYALFPAIALIALAILLPLPHASAYGTFTVNSLGDTTDAAPGDGMCDDGTGNCTLRAAITEANVGVIPVATINIIVTGIIQLGGPLPDLSNDLTINGPGARLLSVRRNTGGNYRIFTIRDGVTASISGLTITNGRTPDSVSGINRPVDGGGIHNSGSLWLTDVTVSGNRTGNGFNGDFGDSGGGGGSGGGIFNGGMLTLTNSTVSGNQTGNGGNAAGGGPVGNGGPGGG